MVNLLPDDQKPKRPEMPKASKDTRPEFKMHQPEKLEGEPVANSTDEIRRKLVEQKSAKKNSEKVIKKNLAPQGNPFLNTQSSQSASKNSASKNRTTRTKKVPIPQMPLKKSKGRISVNLVPEDTLRIVKTELPERLKYLSLFIVLLLGVLGAAWGALAWFQIGTFTNMQEIKNEISNSESEIHQYKTQSSEIIKLRERYDIVKILLKDHVYWTKFFTALEDSTIPDVYYTSFSVKSDKGARITLNARARNVEAVAEQLRVLQAADSFVKEVRINGFSQLSNAQKRGTFSPEGEDIVSFDITMTLKDDVFIVSSPNDS